MARDFSHKISLGQNFLVNREVIRRTVEAGAIGLSDVLLEIGPGQGALTRELLESPCAFLHAVEIDRRPCSGTRSPVSLRTRSRWISSIRLRKAGSSWMRTWKTRDRMLKSST